MSKTSQEILDEIRRNYQRIMTGPSITIGFDAPVDRSRYPHTCTKCKAPAYVGFSTVECSGGCK